MGEVDCGDNYKRTAAQSTELNNSNNVEMYCVEKDWNFEYRLKATSAFSDRRPSETVNFMSIRYQRFCNLYLSCGESRKKSSKAYNINIGLCMPSTVKNVHGRI